MVFQEGALFSHMSVIDNVAFGLRGDGAQERAREWLARVGLFDCAERYPDSLSGGQRQPVAIARALVLNPKLIVADEAVNAPDVFVQGQVLNLVIGLQADLSFLFLFISHNVAVMYLGRIAEIGPRQKVFETLQHPYTVALMKAISIADPTKKQPDRDLKFKAIPSPVHSLDYIPESSVYREITPDHFVLQTHCGY